MERYNQKIKFLVLLCVNIMLIASFASFTYSGEASPSEEDINAISRNTGDYNNKHY